MVDHLSEKQVEDWRKHCLSPADLLAVSDHVDGCLTCRQRLESSLSIDAEFFAIRSEFLEETNVLESERRHLGEAQLAAFVDDTIDAEERSALEDHLSRCESCSLGVVDLRAFRNEIADSLDREVRPAAPSAVKVGWWSRTLESIRDFASPRPAFGLLAAAAVLLVVGTISWLALRPKSSEPAAEIVQVPVSASPAATASPSNPLENTQLLVQVRDGDGLLTLDDKGRLSGAETLPASYQERVHEALTTRRIEKSSQLEGLSRPPSALMSGATEKNVFSVIEPAGVVSRVDRPTFRWSKMADATGYVVEIYDDKFNPVAVSEQVTGQSWTVPQRLTRGKVYTWQVKAMKDGQEFSTPRPPEPQARFRVLDQKRSNELAKAQRDFASSHLVLGLLYADAGLLKEAELELRSVQKANPDSAVVRALIGRIQMLRR